MKEFWCKDMSREAIKRVAGGCATPTLSLGITGILN